MKLTHSRAVVLMVAVTLMWSTAGVVSRHLESARSFEVTFWRSLFTLLSLAVILPLWQGRGIWRKFRSASPALWVSGVCWSLMFTSFMLALTLTSVASVLLIMSLGPMFTALLARVFIGHRLAWYTWLSIVVAGIGMAWMFGAQAQDGGLAGTLVALCVPLSGAVNWTVVQHAHAKGRDVDLVPSVLIGAALSSLYTLPLALPLQATAHDIGLLALLGLVQLAIPCTLSVLCARVLKAPEMALLALLEVVFGILLAWIGAGEAPAAAVLAGGSLVVAALVTNELLGWKLRR
ncbi:MAG: DMT family transporter [Gammaproteobacteria bacterium]|nr:DMT family transporter [Gammaproteobacteria bacterium]